MPQIILDTQKINYNPEKKIAVTTIDEPFMSAGKKLGWRWKSPGIGLNLKVIKFILDTQYTLIINIESFRNKSGKQATFYLSYDKLRHFLTNTNYDYKVRNTIVKVIPIELLTTHQLHTEAS